MSTKSDKQFVEAVTRWRLGPDGKEIESLIIAYGNAMFDCGEFDDDEEQTFEENRQAYRQLVNAAEKAKKALIRAINNA